MILELKTILETSKHSLKGSQ